MMPIERPSDAYRQYAAQCLEIARGLSDKLNKLVLIQMAQTWTELSLQADRNANAAPAQQQQQTQPKKE